MTLHAILNSASGNELEAGMEGAQREPGGTKVRTIHQVAKALESEESLRQMLAIREALRDLGYESEIFLERLDEEARGVALPLRAGSLQPHHAILLHHSGHGLELARRIAAHPGARALILGGLAPERVVEPHDPAATSVEEFRGQLASLAPSFPASVSSSALGALALRAAGFAAPHVMSSEVDPARWEVGADSSWLLRLRDGGKNLLFVGRLSPDEKLEHLLESFRQYLTFDPQGRLHLVGTARPHQPYLGFVREHAERLGIAGQVMISLDLMDAQLAACYRTAHLFWSMGEHDPFPAAAVDAMWFDVPVLAYRSQGAAETLGGSVLLFAHKRWRETAALASLVVHDAPLRQQVIAAQRARRETLRQGAVLPALLQLLCAMSIQDRATVGEAAARASLRHRAAPKSLVAASAVARPAQPPPQPLALPPQAVAPPLAPGANTNGFGRQLRRELARRRGPA